MILLCETVEPSLANVNDTKRQLLTYKNSYCLYFNGTQYRKGKVLENDKWGENAKRNEEL